MSTQIAVRLPDELVAELDSIVLSGEEPSRASIVEQALLRELRRRAWAKEVAVLTAKGSTYEDLDGLDAYLGHLDKSRPVLILTREGVRQSMLRVTVAPITSRAKGLPTELPVGPRNGLAAESVVSLDNILTIRAADIGRRIGFLLPDQEAPLAAALSHAFDLHQQ
jgi:mRNA interferase MazF